MKDKMAMERADYAHRRIDDHYNSIQELTRKVRSLEDKARTSEATLLNMTARLRKIELEIHPECEKCGRVL